jgi:hypothetical protein
VPGGVLVRIPLPIMTVIVAGLSLVVEVLGLVAGYGSRSLLLLFIPGALAAVYLLEYRTLPYEPWHPAPRAVPAPAVVTEDPEEFIDPVEEADRLESLEVPNASSEPSDPTPGPDPPSTPNEAE